MATIDSYYKRRIFEAIRTVEALNPPDRPNEVLMTLRVISNRLKDSPMLLDCLDYYLNISSDYAERGERYYIRCFDTDKGVDVFLHLMTVDGSLIKKCVASIWGVRLQDLGL